MSSKNFNVNLPATPFPMEAKLIERLQPEILQKWRAMDIYRIILEERRTAESFVLHDGPPFASGEMHIGIGFNKILKDIIIKFQSMMGKRVPFVPGWDCHGLPIESQVLNDAKKSNLNLSALEIRERCASNVSQYIREQKNHFQTLGVFADWDRPYSTMAPSYEAGVLHVLAEVLTKGYVYRGLRPVHWCHICQTVLADAEVEERETERTTALIPFQIQGNTTELTGNGSGNLYIFVDFRDIWMLPSTTALMFSPEIKLTTISYTDDNSSTNFIITEEHLAEDICRRLSIYNEEIIRNFKGAELPNFSCVHPLTGKTIPIILETGVEKRSVHGILPVVPAHNIDDYNLALKYNLQIPILIDRYGKFKEEVENVSGQQINEAEEIILSILKKEEVPRVVKTILLNEYYGNRCGHIVYMLPTQQWFVEIDHKEPSNDKTLRERAIEEVSSLIGWINKEDGQKLRRMIETRPDWCISRQRVWGIPIPTIVCSACKEVLLKPEIVKVARDLIALKGSQAWFSMSISELLSNMRLVDMKCDKCGKKDFEKDPEPSVLDVWFESGTSWRSVLINDHRLSFPADLCVEGEDQHRGWFQMSLLLALIMKDRSPFTTVLTHGFILDEKRRAMSRAYGNFVSLKQALEEVPVDLIRLYFVFNKNIREDFPLSVPSILALETEYRTFRNCFRYLLGNLKDYVPSEDAISLTELNDIDKWILCCLHRLINDVTKDYSEFRFKEAMEKLYTFCNTDLSKIYFEAVKDRLYNEAANSHLRRSTQTAMHSIIMALVKMLAPVLVYTCEEVWSYCPGVYDCGSVHMSQWAKRGQGIMNQLEEEKNLLEADYEWMLMLRQALQVELEKAKQTQILSSNNEAKLILYSKVKNRPVFYKSPKSGEKITISINEIEKLASRKQELKDFLYVSEIVIATSTDNLEEFPGLPGLFCQIEKSLHLQCIRCRRFDATVDETSTQPSYCSRCINVLSSDTVNYQSASASPIDEESRPVDVAKYFKELDIRKVAFLNEDGEVNAYYFHLPSQQVREHTGLKRLATYLKNHPDFKNHSAILMGLGEHTDVLFGIGIHQLKHGTPLGGTREFTYENIGQMLENLLRLSYGMSIKNAIGNLPHGGGKSIIDTCGLDLKIHREMRRRIYRDFGQFTATLFGRYICAEDMNNTSADTREMLAWCRHVMCLPEGVGGSGNPSRFTALVGWLAAKAGWKFLQEKEGKIDSTSALDGLTIAIQGVGNVGFNLIDILTEGEPHIRKILVADTIGVQIENVKKMLQRKGKMHLLEIRNAEDPLGDRRNLMPEKIAEIKAELQNPENEKTYILYSQCDILVPAAVGNVIYEQNVDFLNCKIIVPVANNAYSDNDSIGRKIWERNIVDVVEGNVNWGGATVAASELYGYDEDHVIRWCEEKVYSETLQLLRDSQRENDPPWEIKKREAENRFNKPHPTIKVAREGKFIVDISENFNEWIKEKWLRNATSVGSDKFAKHVSEITQSYLNSDLSTITE